MEKTLFIFILIFYSLATFMQGEEIKLIPSAGTYKVPVVLNDSVKLNFTVDSGASIVTMPFDVFSTLLRTGTINKHDFLEEQEFRMANGAIEKYIVFNLKKLKIGNQYIYNVRASSSQHMQGGLLLGQSALRKLEPWRIDSKRGVFYITEEKLSKDKLFVEPKAEHTSFNAYDNQDDIVINKTYHPKYEPKGLYVVSFYNRLNNKEQIYRIYCPTNTVREITNGKWDKSRKSDKEDSYKYDSKKIIQHVINETCKKYQ